MGERYLIDTNALIEFQQKVLPLKSQDFLASVIDSEFNISVINQIEILGSKHVTKETEDFINLANIFDLNTTIVKEAIRIRKVQKIKLPDEIGRASCRERV